LEGLEASINAYQEVLANKDWRVDSDFWTKEPYRNPELRYEAIGDHLTQSQYGISIAMNEDRSGIPIYRMNEMHDMLCDYSIMKSAEVTDKEVAQFGLTDRDVLFNRTNSYQWVGRTGLYKGNEGARAVFASYLVRFRTHEASLLPEFLTAYLSCKFGQQEIKRRSRQSINQTNVNPEEVKEILLPVVGMALQRKIKAAFDQAHQARLIALEQLSAAEEILLAALGLVDWTPPEPLSYTARASDAFAAERLDAQYFMPAKEQVRQSLAALSGQMLGDRVDSIRDMFVPDRARPDMLVRNYDVTDALVPLLDAEKEPQAAGEIGSVKKALKDGDLAISRLRAYLREIAVVRTGDDIPSVGSSEFIVLRPKRGQHDISAETLMVFLRSPPAQTILKWCQDGSQHPRFSEGDLLSIPVPDAVAAVSGQITTIVQEGFAARNKARQLLEASKRAVEIAIEEGEPATLAFLDAAEGVN
jgi:hypothetical protein